MKKIFQYEMFLVLIFLLLAIFLTHYFVSDHLEKLNNEKKVDQIDKPKFKDRKKKIKNSKAGPVHSSLDQDLIIWNEGNQVSRAFLSLNEIVLNPKNSKTKFVESEFKKILNCNFTINRYMGFIFLKTTKIFKRKALIDVVDTLTRKFGKNFRHIGMILYSSRDKDYRSQIIPYKEFIVGFHDATSSKEVLSTEEKYSLKDGKKLMELSFVYKTDSVMKTIRIVNKLHKEKSVEYAYPNCWKYMELK